MTSSSSMYFDSLKFLLTRPLRDVTITIDVQITEITISTHTPLAGRDENDAILICDYKISTHTPLAGRDSQWVDGWRETCDFYSHAPCGT